MSLTPNARISDILAGLAADQRERIPVGAILGVLGDRAFALLVVLLGLPNCLPMPPPIPLLCGLLLALVAAQIVAGRSEPWFPASLRTRSIATADVRRAVARALPVLRTLERWSRPRMTVFDTGPAFRLTGALLLVLAAGLLVAAPVVGQIPLGIAVCLVGLGLVERDGVVVLAGLSVGSVGFLLSLGFVYAIFSGLERVL